MPNKIIPPKAGFTVTFLNKLKAQDKPYEISDPGCKGLRVKLTTSGSKIFLSTIRIKGKRRVITLGHFPSVGLEEARTDLKNRKIANKKGELLTDKDRKLKEQSEQALKEAQEKSDNILLETVIDEWEKLIIYPRRSAKSTISMINVHIRGLGEEFHPDIVLAGMPIRSVTKQDVKELIFNIRDSRPGIAIELFPMLLRFFSWSVRQGYINSSPISSGDKKDWKLVKQPKVDFALDVDDRGRVISTLPDIKRFFNILDSEYSKKVALPLKILLLTGVRSGELLLAKKEHIDFDKMEWFIPKENTKSYRPEKNIDTSIIIPLAPYTAELFREAMKISDTDRVITAAKNTLPWAVKVIVTKYSFKKFTPHTLRKTLRSHIITWTRYEVAEKCLNHSLGQLEDVYDHGSMLDERREALNIWSEKIYRAVYDSESNVVPLRG